MADFRISQGARRPSLRSTLLSAGKPVSLTNATVRFVMWTTNGHVVEGEAVIESAVKAQVRFDWPLNSTNIPGTYQAEWRIKYADDQVLAVPSDRFTHVRITGTNLAVATDSGAGTVAEAIAAAVEEHEAKNPAHDADKVSLSAAGVTANRVGAGFVEVAAALAGLDAGDVGADPVGTAAAAVDAHEASDPAHSADQISLDVAEITADRVGAGLVELAASIAGLDAGDVGAVPVSTVGEPGGVASLDAEGTVPAAQLDPPPSLLRAAADLDRVVAWDDFGRSGTLHESLAPSGHEWAVLVGGLTCAEGVLDGDASEPSLGAITLADITTNNSRTVATTGTSGARSRRIGCWVGQGEDDRVVVLKFGIEFRIALVAAGVSTTLTSASGSLGNEGGNRARFTVCMEVSDRGSSGWGVQAWCVERGQFLSTLIASEDAPTFDRVGVETNHASARLENFIVRERIP